VLFLRHVDVYVEHNWWVGNVVRSFYVGVHVLWVEDSMFDEDRHMI